jgi:hypothetical protein
VEAQLTNRLDSSQASSPLDRATESVLRAIDAPERYPSGASFIAADLPSFDSHFRRATGEGRPVVVVLPDGEELLLRPRPGLHSLIRRGWRALGRRLPFARSLDAGPLVDDGVPGEPFEIALPRLSVAGYEAHLLGLRR